MEQLIYELNNIKYLLFEAELYNKKDAESFQQRIKEHE